MKRRGVYAKNVDEKESEYDNDNHIVLTEVVLFVCCETLAMMVAVFTTSK